MKYTIVALITVIVQDISAHVSAEGDNQDQRGLRRKNNSPWKGKGPTKEKGLGALVIKNKKCVFLDGTPLPDTGVVTATRSIEVTNDNNGLESCKFDNVTNPTNDVVKWNYENTVGEGADGYGFFCCIGNEEKGILTTDWTQTISPSGESILVCKFDYAGITADIFDGTLARDQTTYPCNNVYPTFTCC